MRNQPTHSLIILEMGMFFGFLWLVTLAAANPITQREREDVVNFYNKVRSNVYPSAADMLELVSFVCFRLSSDYFPKYFNA